MNKARKKTKCRPRAKQPRTALVACKDSLAKVRQMAGRWGVDLSPASVMSRKDNPELSTFEDIITALPPSIEWLFLDDVDHLLPEGKRDPESVRPS